MSSKKEPRLSESREDGHRFEKLVGALSSTFISADSADVDREIEHALGVMGTFLGSDRCYVFALNEDGTHHRVTHVWTAGGIERDPDVENVVVQEVFPWLGQKMLRHEDIVVSTLDDLPPEASREREYSESRNLRSFLMCPMYSHNLVVGNIGLDLIRQDRAWSEEDSRRLRLVGEIIANAIVRGRKDREIQRLTERLEAENVYLREKISLEQRHEEIVGESEPLHAALQEVERVAPTETIVLLQGETGTGKELFANAIHRMSERASKAMISVNCAALATTLIESELFGREKGAYTGALSRQVGRFELADGSTLFLDEVGELPAEVQAKLLRVLQSGEFERLGSTVTQQVDARIIAATNRDLSGAVADGTFRKDLFYRLNVYPITVPPLRERVDDIPLLVWAFVREFERSMGKRVERIPEADMASLQRQPWPGNVRELRNVIERSMIRAQTTTLHIRAPQGDAEAGSESVLTLEEIERRHILSTLERTGWRVRGAGGAAELLGLKPTTLESRMKRLGIQRKV